MNEKRGNREEKVSCSLFQSLVGIGRRVQRRLVESGERGEGVAGGRGQGIPGGGLDNLQAEVWRSPGRSHAIQGTVADELTLIKGGLMGRGQEGRKGDVAKSGCGCGGERSAPLISLVFHS